MHFNTDTSLLRTVCFVPGKTKRLLFHLIQPPYYGHPVDTDTSHGPLVSVLTEFDCTCFLST